jgi:glucose-1-phosphatase
MIKAVIFDIGNVVIKHPEKVYSKVTLRFGLSKDRFLAKTMKDFLLCQQGKISYDEYWKRAAKKFGISEQDRKRSISEIHEAFYRHGKIDKGVIRIIEKLKDRYKLGCLTNTMPEHFSYHKKNKTYSHFDVVVASHQVGLTKPDRRIFLVTLKRLGIKPAEAVFVDDNKVFVRAACGLGMKSILFLDAARLMKDLKRLKVI